MDGEHKFVYVHREIYVVVSNVVLIAFFGIYSRFPLMSWRKVGSCVYISLYCIRIAKDTFHESNGSVVSVW